MKADIIICTMAVIGSSDFKVCKRVSSYMSSHFSSGLTISGAFLTYGLMKLS